MYKLVYLPWSRRDLAKKDGESPKKVKKNCKKKKK